MDKSRGLRLAEEIYEFYRGMPIPIHLSCDKIVKDNEPKINSDNGGKSRTIDQEKEQQQWDEDIHTQEA